MKCKILYDWLSFTSKIHSIHDIIELLGLNGVNFQSITGARGYRDRLYFDNISIHYNGREDMGVWCEMSGQGCRNFESYGNGDYESIFQEILFNEKQMNLTRLDIACDDHEGFLDIKKLSALTKVYHFVSMSQNCGVEWSSKEGLEGITISHGSKKSKTFIRIYDKAAERGFTDRHWIRVEIQLRDGNAVGFIKNGSSDVGKTFFGVLNRYLRYVKYTATDSNIRRWDTFPMWARFLEHTQSISVYSKPGSEYNLHHLDRFVEGCTAGAVHTYLKIHGDEHFKEMLEKKSKHLNPKYEELIFKRKLGESI